MTVSVGINGLGIIGRRFLRIVLDHYPGIRVVAVNDIGDIRALAHLLKYDSNYGRLQYEVGVDGQNVVIGEHRVRFHSETDPGCIPWTEAGVSIVIEATGRFQSKNVARQHIVRGGVNKVVISAPGNDDDLSIVMGVNEHEYDPDAHHVVSNSSCTTNCLAPVVKVLDENFGFNHGLMSTVHAYTNGQNVLDLHHSDLRRARAAAVNIIPTTTGAIAAIGRVLPDVQDRLDGISYRVPVSAVSLVDLVSVLDSDVDVTQVNKAMQLAASTDLAGILSVTGDPVVSSDIKGVWESAVVDLSCTQVVANLARVVAWYDNEWAYCARLADLVEFIAKQRL